MLGDLSASGLLRLKGYARGKVLSPHFGAASDYLVLYSRASPKVPHKQFAHTTLGLLVLHGTAKGYRNEPFGSFQNFAFYTNSLVDPQQVLVNKHTGGATTSGPGTTAGFQRLFVNLATPLDCYGSEGEKLWSRAAYASVGLKFKGVPTAGYELVTGIQAEISKYSADPLPYQPARSLDTTIYPEEINYVTNPAGITTLGTVVIPLGTMPKVKSFADGNDYTAWQSTEHAYTGLTSVAVQWSNTIPQSIPGELLYPSDTLFPLGA